MPFWEMAGYDRSEDHLTELFDASREEFNWLESRVDEGQVVPNKIEITSITTPLTSKQWCEQFSKKSQQGRSRSRLIAPRSQREIFRKRTLKFKSSVDIRAWNETKSAKWQLAKKDIAEALQTVLNTKIKFKLRIRYKSIQALSKMKKALKKALAEVNGYQEEDLNEDGDRGKVNQYAQSTYMHIRTVSS